MWRMFAYISSFVCSMLVKQFMDSGLKAVLVRNLLIDPFLHCLYEVVVVEKSDVWRLRFGDMWLSFVLSQNLRFFSCILWAFICIRWAVWQEKESTSPRKIGWRSHIKVTLITSIMSNVCRIQFLLRYQSESLLRLCTIDKIIVNC